MMHNPSCYEAEEQSRTSRAYVVVEALTEDREIFDLAFFVCSVCHIKLTERRRASAGPLSIKSFRS